MELHRLDSGQVDQIGQVGSFPILLTWPHLALPSFTWPHLALPGFTWPHLASLGLTWPYLASPGLT